MPETKQTLKSAVTAPESSANSLSSVARHRRVRASDTLTGNIAQHIAIIKSQLTAANLRGGMVDQEVEDFGVSIDDEETRTPTLFSNNYPEDNPEAGAANRAFSFCTDDIPDLEPLPGIANGNAAQPAPMRRVTSATSVHASSTVLVTEPHQVVLSRAVAQEDADRPTGVVATNSTPVQGAVQNLDRNNQNLAEYVGRRFGLDGITDVITDNPEPADPVESQAITFREPNYGHTGTPELVAPENDAETDLDRNGSRRLSAAVRNARSRLREFFPRSDVVTSSRASFEGHTSARSDLPAPLRRTASEQNLLSRAASRIFPRNNLEQSPTSNGSPPMDETSSSGEDGLFMNSEQSRQGLLPQGPRPSFNDTGKASVVVESSSDPVVSQMYHDTVASTNVSQRGSIPDANQTMGDVATPDTRTERQASSTSLMRRAMHRLSTSLTFGSRFGSHDDTNAPPPTRDGPPVPEHNVHHDEATEHDQQDTQRTTSRVGTRLRHAGSSTLNLVRRAASRFPDAPDEDTRPSGAEREPTWTERRQPDSARSGSRGLRGTLEGIGRIATGTVGAMTFAPTGGVLEPVIPEGPRSTEPATADNTNRRRRDHSRQSIFPEWQRTFRRATASMRRGSTPHGHGPVQATEPEESRPGEASNVGRTGLTTTQAPNNEEATSRHNPATADVQARSSHATAQAETGPNEQGRRSWRKSVAVRVRDVGRSEQNVFAI